MAAGIATLTELRKPGQYETLERKGQRIEEGFKKVLHDKHIPGQLQRIGAMFCLYFNEQPVTNYAQAKQSDTQRFARYFWEMLAQGIYLPPSQFESCFISLAQDDAHLEETIRAANVVMGKIG
jgi:glutamate-1-semialdehyde 2,1-aminomutase